MDASAVVHHQNTLTLNVYDTFYTPGYLLNKDLQDKIAKQNSKEDDIEV